MAGYVIGLITLDEILWFFTSSVMGIALEFRVRSDLLDNDSADPASLGIPSHMITDLECLWHLVSDCPSRDPPSMAWVPPQVRTERASPIRPSERLYASVYCAQAPEIAPRCAWRVLAHLDIVVASTFRSSRYLRSEDSETKRQVVGRSSEMRASQPPLVVDGWGEGRGAK